MLSTKYCFKMKVRALRFINLFFFIFSLFILKEQLNYNYKQHLLDELQEQSDEEKNRLTTELEFKELKLKMLQEENLKKEQAELVAKVFSII